MLSADMLKLNLMAPANSLNHNVQNPTKKKFDGSCWSFYGVYFFNQFAQLGSN